MSWIREDERTWIQKFCGNVLKQGPIPKHVGFIMDGNRRYAKKADVTKIEGHTRGFEKLAETLRWCRDMGITEVTVYAFSIENFKRSPEEVDALVNLAKEKFEKLLEEQEKLDEEGVCVQIIGDWSLVPEKLKPLMAKSMLLTKNNTKTKLNVAFAYTSRNEMTRGIQHLVDGIDNGDLNQEDLSEELLEDTFQLLPAQPLDLLVRTSGETRLSDFLLWQSSESVLCFTTVLWPEFTFWHLLGAIFNYQVNHMAIQKMKKSETRPTSVESTARIDAFLDKLRTEQWDELRSEATKLGDDES
jgi:ditrans,polycis-polyprenyl diphosphate synthase